MCIDKFDNIVNKYNNICYRTIKMNPIDTESSTYIDLGVENNDRF